MYFLGFKHHLFRFRKANAFYYLSALCALMVICAFFVLIATLVFRALPVIQSPYYSVEYQDYTAELLQFNDTVSRPLVDDVSAQHGYQDLSLKFSENTLQLQQGDVTIRRNAFIDVLHIFPSQIPYIFYLHTKNSFETQLLRLHWQPNKPMQIKNLMSLPAEVKVTHVLESDIHNVLQVVTQDQRGLVSRMINLVTAESFDEVILEGTYRLLDSSRQQVRFVSDEQMAILNMNNLAASVTLNELFFAQTFPGYDAPSQTWQTNPAQDYQLRKYNIIPLLMGSLKAALLSIFVALPIALGAALYVGFLEQRGIRVWLKPLIEVLESIPSVIIGLIAATIFINVAASVLWGVVALLFLLPIFMLLCGLSYRFCKHKMVADIVVRYELFFIGIGLIGFLWLCFSQIGPMLVTLSPIQALTPDNQVTLIIAIALGIGISPTIFSIAEDAIHNVPKSMVKASYALGASRTQTLVQIVMFTAFPGLVAAAMLGFGRAFGETMIVLMVSGNTPIAEWDLFTGLRALTANLVIEMPEAKSENSHLVVLFFTAFLLFAFTFFLNSIAEFLRQQNKKARGVIE